MRNLFIGAAGLAAGMAAAGATFAQDVTRFENGYLTFTNRNPALYYRLEFRPNMTASADWDGNHYGWKNIRSGDPEITLPVGVFYRIVGSAEPVGIGTAGPAHVLATKTVFVDGREIVGTMPHRGAQHVMPGTAARIILRGYHDGTGEVSGDLELISGNIKAGASIFGVGGKPEVVDTWDATAVAADLMEGKVAYSAGRAVTGTIATATLSDTTTVVRAGYYAATNLLAVDTFLNPANIRAGTSIFGVEGVFFGNLLPTGQTNVYEPDDDGYHRSETGPAVRFMIGSGDAGTHNVTDRATGLMWRRFPSADTMNWKAAIRYCQAMNAASEEGTYGFNDWRLPNVREMQSLIDYGRTNPALPPDHPFADVQPSIYWTSTTSAFSENYAWRLSLDSGIKNIADKMTSAFYVWPVRSASVANANLE